MTAAAAVKTAVGMSTQFCAGWPTMHGTCRAAVNQKAGAGVAEAAVEGVVEVGRVAKGPHPDHLAHSGRAAAGPREPRQRVANAWGTFQVAPVSSHGVQIGWGGTCKKHLNDFDSASACCKKQIPFGKKAPFGL